MSIVRTLVTEKKVCSLPWLHTEINLQNNSIKPCCKFSKNIATASEEFKVTWYGNDYTQLRQYMAEGKPIIECSACNVPPNVFSYKKWKNSAYSTMLDIDSTNPGLPKVFHLSLKNTCNLACRMCHPNSSSKFNQLINKSTSLRSFYGTADTSTVNIEQFKGSFTNAEHITISGGEPLIDYECVTLVNMIKEEAKKLRSINFSTNMTKLNKDLVNMLSSTTSKVVFSISLDGPKNIHEYIRYGCEWKDIIDNIRYIKNTAPNIQFSINTTLSALNVGYVAETLETFHSIEQELGIKFNDIMVSPVLFPTYLHPSVVPPLVKELYIDKIKKINTAQLSIPNSTMLVATALDLLKETGEFNTFKEFIDEFDRITNTSFKDVYPEYWSGVQESNPHS